MMITMARVRYCSVRRIAAEIMFKLMNAARLGTALQGLAIEEVAYQGAMDYARERLQMRSLTGPKPGWPRRSDSGASGCRMLLTKSLY